MIRKNDPRIKVALRALAIAIGALRDGDTEQARQAIEVASDALAARPTRGAA